MKLIISGIMLVLKSIKPEDVEKVADKILDFVEDKYIGNAVVENGCLLIRNAFSIEDND
jgi:hypothetical protein